MTPTFIPHDTTRLTLFLAGPGDDEGESDNDSHSCGGCAYCTECD